MMHLILNEHQHSLLMHYARRIPSAHHASFVHEVIQRLCEDGGRCSDADILIVARELRQEFGPLIKERQL